MNFLGVKISKNSFTPWKDIFISIEIKYPNYNEWLTLERR